MQEDKKKMKLSGLGGKKFASIVSALMLSGLLVACGSSNSSTINGNNGVGCKKVGVLLPETASSARWDGSDRPDLQKDIPATLSGATVDYSNAQGNSATQQTQADADLTKGDCILVLAPNDAVAAAHIVADAKADNVPVISYDRLTQSNDLAYYVSFDGVQVGKLQGQYIASHYMSYVSAGHNNIVFINGATTDNNAKLFSQGAHDVLDPLISSGALKKVYEVFTPNWDNPTAQTEMQGALTAQSNNIQIAYVANDGMAGTVIAALQQQKLAGKVLVTGQDATVTGLQDILLGTQSMTVFKNIALEAQATANVVAAISNGTSTSSLTNGATTQTSGGANIKSILETPQSIDKTNVMDVITAGYVTKAALCAGLPAGTGGIC